MRTTILFIISFLSYFALNGQTHTSEIIKKAVSDEIERNMKELTMDEHEKPFFIAFSVGDVETMSVLSILGSQVTSSINKARTNNCRVMVGDYQINDENFVSNSFNNSNDISYLGLPIDDDYYGIRRAVWISVNNVYKSAAKKYKSKIKELERNKIPIDSLELEDFSKEDIVKLDIEAEAFDFEKEKYEELADELSSVFKNYAEVVNSSVSILFYKSRVYFINSEGTNVSFPMNIATISIDASVLCDDGTSISNGMSYVVAAPQDLPGKAEMISDVNKFATNLIELREAQLQEETYEGPVLFLGEIAASIFTSSLFQGEEGLIASREALSLDGKTYGYNRSGSQKSRIGRKIANEDLSVTLYPKLKEYDGVKLIGEFEIDGEGVIPPDTLKLLENGKIVGLLNSRTPSIEEKHSNGHYRPSLSNGYLSRSMAPSVVMVETTEPKSYDSLKATLIEKAKEEDLEYALIFKSLDIECSDAPLNAYKVDVETGEEELIRGLSNMNYNGYELKDAMGVSDKRIIINSTMYGGYGASVSGVPYSIICPDGILFEEMEFVGTRLPYVPDLPIMPSPLEEANKK